jgi:tetratricopeptide (TPR) repeat protein
MILEEEEAQPWVEELEQCLQSPCLQTINLTALNSSASEIVTEANLVLGRLYLWKGFPHLAFQKFGLAAKMEERNKHTVPPIRRAETLHHLGRAACAQSRAVLSNAAAARGAPDAGAGAAKVDIPAMVAEGERLTAIATTYLKLALGTYKKEVPVVGLDAVSRVADAWADIALIYRNKGDHLQEAKILQQELATRAALGSAKDRVTASRTMIQLGKCYRLLQDSDKQREVLERCLSIQQQHYTRHLPETATTMFTLAMLAGKRADFSTVVTLVRLALSILEKHQSSDSTLLAARCLKSLADALGAIPQQQQDDQLQKEADIVLAAPPTPESTLALLKERKELLLCALALQIEQLGKDHLEVSFTSASLANVFGEEGDLKRKQKMLFDATRLQKAVLGPDHPEVGRTLTNLGNTFVGCDDAAMAKKVLDQALTIKVRAYGPTSNELVKTQASLANVEAMLGNFDRAAELHIKTLDIIQQEHRNEACHHPDTLLACKNLGQIQMKCGDAAGAVISFKRWLSAQDASVGMKSPLKLMQCLLALAEAQHASGKQVEELGTLQRLFAIQENQFDENNIKTIKVLLNISEVQAGLNDWSASRDSLQAAVHILENEKDEPDDDVAANDGDMSLDDDLLPLTLVKLGWAFAAAAQPELGIAAMHRAVDLLTHTDHTNTPLLEAAQANLSKLIITTLPPPAIAHVSPVPQRQPATYSPLNMSTCQINLPLAARGGLGDLRRMAEGSKMSLWDSAESRAGTTKSNGSDCIDSTNGLTGAQSAPSATPATPPPTLGASNAFLQVPIAPASSGQNDLHDLIRGVANAAAIRHMPSPLARGGSAPSLQSKPSMVQRSQSSVLDIRLLSRPTGLGNGAAAATNKASPRRDTSQQIIRQGLSKEEVAASIGTKLIAGGKHHQPSAEQPQRGDCGGLQAPYASVPIPVQRSSSSNLFTLRREPSSQAILRKDSSQQVLKREASRPMLRRAPSQQMVKRAPSQQILMLQRAHEQNISNRAGGSGSVPSTSSQPPAPLPSAPAHGLSPSQVLRRAPSQQMVRRGSSRQVLVKRVSSQQLSFHRGKGRLEVFSDKSSGGGDGGGGGADALKDGENARPYSGLATKTTSTRTNANGHTETAV